MGYNPGPNGLSAGCRVFGPRVHEAGIAAHKADDPTGLVEIAASRCSTGQNGRNPDAIRWMQRRPCWLAVTCIPTHSQNGQKIRALGRAGHSTTADRVWRVGTVREIRRSERARRRCASGFAQCTHWMLILLVLLLVLSDIRLTDPGGLLMKMGFWHAVPRFAQQALLMSTILLGTVSAGQAEDFEMLPSATLEPAGTEPQVIGGVRADPAQWPATLVFRTSAGGCTATVIGKRAVLTAAHCVTNGATGKIKLAPDKEVALKCSHHPGYPNDISVDYALCSAGADLPDVTEGFERIGTIAPKSGDSIVLIGYGCIRKGGVDHTFGQLWWGSATVATVSNSSSYFVTKGAAVCYGDSGGAAYSVANGGNRVIVGVNSRGDISTYSSISTTRTNGFVDWAKGWSRDNSAPICGIEGGAGKCRQQ